MPEPLGRFRQTAPLRLVPPVYGPPGLARARIHDHWVNGALDSPGTGYGHPVERSVVLVVEDEPSIRLLCRINLELEGFDVLEAGSLAEARVAISENELSLVLLDLRIGNERGTDLIEELRGRGVPVALVTGSTEHEPESEGIADAYLHKPFAIADLLRTVKDLSVH